METLFMTLLTALVSSVVGALVGAVVSKIKTVSRTAEESKETQRQTLLLTCRMAIYDDHFSVDEKLDAYVTYRDICHGNHQTKKYMDKLVGCDVDEYLEKHS